MTGHVLHLIEGCTIPEGCLAVDIKYFDRDSLERMYGRRAVAKYLDQYTVKPDILEAAKQYVDKKTKKA